MDTPAAAAFLGPGCDSTDPISVALNTMRSVMEKLRRDARDMCGQYLAACEVKRILSTRRLILRQLNGQALKWDNLDPGALMQMVACLVETSDRFGDVGHGMGISLMMLRGATEGFADEQNEMMEEALEMTERLMPLVEKLKEAFEEVTDYVEDVGGWNVEGLMNEMKAGPEQRRATVAKLTRVMEVWTVLGEWLDQLLITREAVVSVRERVMGKRIAIWAGTVNPPKGQMN